MITLPLHPKLVHLPIALAVLMPLLTSGLLLAWLRGWLPKRTWVIAFAVQALLFVSGWFAMNTGEADEDRVERFVPEQAIEAHEDAATTFVWGNGLVLVLALLPLVLRRARPAQIAAVATVAGTAVVLFLGYRVGESGGELVYRHGAAAAFVEGGGGNAPVSPDAGRRDRDDDDR